MIYETFFGLETYHNSYCIPHISEEEVAKERLTNYNFSTNTSNIHKILFSIFAIYVAPVYLKTE